MSTRAMYTFIDNDSTVHVYKHSDGYPTGAAQWISAALAFAWPLPRYEADEFAAAFVCANKLPYWMQTPTIAMIDKLAKTQRSKKFFDDKIVSVKFPVPSYAMGKNAMRGGGVRLMPSGAVQNVAPSDIEYRYEVSQGNDGALRVRVYTVDNWNNYSEELILDCRLDAFEQAAKELEAQQNTAA